ncbi:MAG: saccharopine dehydrogenase NADP-binding domain-containing protein [candidate division WOR-3 bacterium]|uniref:Saccharopine dehydrogenase n=1 Tax=candidate division WOR-3 bacterium TaxID=2052148 RepID=A0A7C1N9D1_UNCW3|nr:saccharopine dehydrogenase NADP-binding domain-containing protein [candidate division WOR-3 bacterium]
MKRVLILGAGLVSRPMVRYLLNLNDVELTVATRTVSKALELIGTHPRGRAVELLADDESNLHRLIASSDIVVSLLPYTYHPTVARHCIALKKHLVTTSYVSEAMKALDNEARRTGIILLNEIGLDPGIDHMSAMALIDRVKANGGRIISFISSCGGLPAPEANDNPLGYKFSWSPRGVLMAGRNDARFLKDGREILIPASQLFASSWRQKITGVGELEAYPNRNSLPYIELYGLEGIRTMIRATLRYPGWCETMQAISELGLLRDERVRNDLNRLTYAQWFREYVPGTGRLQEDTAVRLNLPVNHPVLQRLEWLGLFSDAPIMLESGSNLDILAKAMLERMSYKRGERDMIVLHHQFVVEYSDRRERIESTLIDYGEPEGDTAMARTVSLPAAVAVKMLIDGSIKLTGVQIPVRSELYQPIMAELSKIGFRFQEQTLRLD